MAGFVQIQNSLPPAAYLFGQGLSQAIDQQMQQQQNAKIYQAIAQLAQNLYGNTSTPPIPSSLTQGNNFQNSIGTSSGGAQNINVIPTFTSGNPADAIPKSTVPPNPTDYSKWMTGDYTGMNNEFQSRIAKMAEANGTTYNISSGRRSLQQQQDLWDASDKSGVNVAPAGRSRHNYGLGADSTDFNGVSDEELSKYGLYRPMSYEPWHVEPIETRGVYGADMANILNGEKKSEVPPSKQNGLTVQNFDTGNQQNNISGNEVKVPTFKAEDVTKALTSIQGKNIVDMYKAMALVSKMPGVDMAKTGPLVQQMFGQKLDAELGAERAKFLSSGLADLNDDAINGKTDAKKALRYATIFQNLGFHIDMKSFMEAYKDPDIKVHELKLGDRNYLVGMDAAGKVKSVVGGSVGVSQEDVLKYNTEIKKAEIGAGATVKGHEISAGATLEAAKIRGAENTTRNGLTKTQAEAKASAYNKQYEQIKQAVLAAKNDKDVFAALQKLDQLKAAYEEYKDALKSEGYDIDQDHYDMNEIYGKGVMRRLYPGMTFKPYGPSAPQEQPTP